MDLTMSAIMALSTAASPVTKCEPSYNKGWMRGALYGSMMMVTCAQEGQQSENCKVMQRRLETRGVRILPEDSDEVVDTAVLSPRVQKIFKWKPSR